MEDTLAKKITPRKMPVQDRSKQTVEYILQASISILETDGMKGFNTNAIAKKAGVSIGSLYQYFPSKDAIMNELIQRYFKDQDAQIYKYIESLDNSTDIKFVIDMFIERWYEILLSQPQVSRILLKQVDSPALRSKIDELDAKMLEFIYATFKNKFNVTLDINQLHLTVEAVKGMNDYYFKHGHKRIDINEVIRCAKSLVKSIL